MSFPSLFMLFNFNTSVAYYEASSTAGKYTLDAPLPKNGGVLTIGYGSGGAPAQTFYLRPGQNFDIGFLKIFLSTKPVDLSSIPQPTPFEKTRSGDRLAKNEEEAWGTMLIPVLQRSSDPASLGATKQLLQIQGLQAENIALKRENDVLHGNILALQTELQQEKAERQRVETRQARVEKAKSQAALDQQLENSPKMVPPDKKQDSWAWRLKKLRWW